MATYGRALLSLLPLARLYTVIVTVIVVVVVFIAVVVSIRTIQSHFLRQSAWYVLTQ